MKSSDVVLIIAAVIFPPIAVFLVNGWGEDLLISALLTLVGYFPGLIHVFYLIYRKFQAEETYGEGQYESTGHGNYQPINSAAPTPPSYGAV
ncbi:hypothetical protein C8J56DRAFT_916366 [Mycena floridula]|nr:hypothetical protein C8J56DRAFT_916366 [Mycena floridula]